MQTPEECGNEICRHRARFFIENESAEEVACANHLAWGIRKVLNSGNHADVRELEGVA